MMQATTSRRSTAVGTLKIFIAMIVLLQEAVAGERFASERTPE
jgi:hypothetical protein